MKQYCRYCANAVLIDEELAYCESKHETKHKKKCTTVNNCKHFAFCELDVFDTDKKYQPKKVKNSAGSQIKMEV